MPRCSKVCCLKSWHVCLLYLPVCGKGTFVGLMLSPPPVITLSSTTPLFDQIYVGGMLHILQWMVHAVCSIMQCILTVSSSNHHWCLVALAAFLLFRPKEKNMCQAFIRFMLSAVYISFPFSAGCYFKCKQVSVVLKRQGGKKIRRVSEGPKVEDSGNVFETIDWNERWGMGPFSAFIFLCLPITCSGEDKSRLGQVERAQVMLQMLNLCCNRVVYFHESVMCVSRMSLSKLLIFSVTQSHVRLSSQIVLQLHQCYLQRWCIEYLKNSSHAASDGLWLRCLQDGTCDNVCQCVHEGVGFHVLQVCAFLNSFIYVFVHLKCHFTAFWIGSFIICRLCALRDCWPFPRQSLKSYSQ